MTATIQPEAINNLDRMFESHPSLSASLEDFEDDEKQSPMLKLPSQHSGFRDDSSEPGNEDISDGPWSPTGWKGTMSSGNGWYRHKPYVEESPLKRFSGRSTGLQSRDRGSRSPIFDDDDPTLPMNVPLPRGSMSPEKDYATPNPDLRNKRETGTQASPIRDANNENEALSEERKDNYIRFAVRAEVQHRTDTVEHILSWLRIQIDSLTKSRMSLLGTFTTIFLSFVCLRLLTGTPIETPYPDVVKAAGLARSFEPMIYYSENGGSQIEELQETGTAVWDLTESMRAANMTSAPIIVSELDELSKSLKTLAEELQYFFVSVGGDVDAIIQVMEWSKRELDQLTSSPSSSNPLSSAFSNLVSLFSSLGLLSDPHVSSAAPTTLDIILSRLIARTPAQRTRLTLERTFTELLSTLEDTINSELQATTSLFALFAGIDRQFLNLQRVTVREIDTQERLEGEVLSSLWKRATGSGRNQLRKYEKNRRLLQSVRERTVANKNLLVEHSGKLMALKGSLEHLRRRLVGPLFKGDGAAVRGSTVGIEAQIEGLEGTYVYLRDVRQGQRERWNERMFGARGRREKGSGVVGIEGGI